MNLLRKFFIDPSFFLLLVFNAWTIYEYKVHPESYPTMVWLFWCQSVLIGIFNFLELLTTKNVNVAGFKINHQPVDPEKGRGCYAFFFLFHYGAFHLGYLIFIAIQVGIKNIDPVIFKVSLLLLFANQTFAFFHHKQVYKEGAPTLAFLFFAPYLRVIPMHLMILGPAFFHWQPAMIFLILKAFMDIVGYLLTLNLRAKPLASHSAY